MGAPSLTQKVLGFHLFSYATVGAHAHHNDRLVCYTRLDRRLMANGDMIMEGTGPQGRREVRGECKDDVEREAWCSRVAGGPAFAMCEGYRGSYVWQGCGEHTHRKGVPGVPHSGSTGFDTGATPFAVPSVSLPLFPPHMRFFASKRRHTCRIRATPTDCFPCSVMLLRRSPSCHPAARWLSR